LQVAMFGARGACMSRKLLVVSALTSVAGYCLILLAAWLTRLCYLRGR